MDSRGYVAPPTVWPLDLALAPPGTIRVDPASLSKTAATDGALWLPGWGTFLSPSIAAAGGLATIASATIASATIASGMMASATIATSTDGAGGKDDPWPWLGVLTAMSACAEDSTPFLRLGGSPHTDLSNVCHEVSTAGRRGSSSSGSRFDKSGNNTAASAGGHGVATLWRGQQKALVEAALDEGVRMVHVPGLEGSTSSGTGVGTGSGGGSGGVSGGGGSGGGSGGGGASWPGPAGYSFACWMRFNPPTGAASGASGARGDGGAGGSFGDGSPEDMMAWREDAKKAAKTAAAVATAVSGNGGGGVGGGGGKTTGITSRLDMAAEGEEELAGDGVDVSADRASPGSGRGSGGTAADGGVERGESVDASKVDGDGSVPRPHLPGRQVCVCFRYCMYPCSKHDNTPR